MYKVEEIIQALGEHEDNAAVAVLEEVGTNASDEYIRKITAEALVKRNSHDSLKVLLINSGKGIHDLNVDVSSHVINSLKSSSDKSEMIKILEDTISLHSDESVKNKAREVKELLLSAN